MLSCGDPWSSLDSQDFRYDAGYGRTGAEIYTISEVTFSWALVSFASSVTFDLPLEDLIQGLGDTSWVLVQGWDGDASGRVKSQLPSLGLEHIWDTTYISSSLWKQDVASLSILEWNQTQTCFILFHVLLPLRPHWFLWENFKKNFGCTRLSLLLRTSLFAAAGANLWFQCAGFSFLCFSWCRSQALGHSGSVVVAHRLSCPRAFAIFPN